MTQLPEPYRDAVTFAFGDSPELADELLALVADTLERQVEHLGNLVEPLEEDFAGLPMATLEVLHDRSKLLADLAITERQDGVDQAARASGIGSIPLPGEVEGADNDAGRVRLKPERMEL